jgi:ssDNA-binding Zn-finger/Zn-ribbon topoisomerase 1
MCEDHLDLAKRSPKCLNRTYFLSGEYITKVRCLRCPKCNSRLQNHPSLLDSTEVCSSCDYKRQVFTDEELAQLRV